MTSIKNFLFPSLGDNIPSATVIKILIKEGDAISTNDPVVEVESEKATAEIPSTLSGTIKEIFIKVGTTLKTGDPIFSLTTSEVTKEVSNKVEIEATPLPPEQKVIEEIHDHHTPKALTLPKHVLPQAKSVATAASPSVRRFAREIGVTIKDVVGSNKGGRISIDDVKKHAKSLLLQQNNNPTLSSNSYKEPLPDFSKWGSVQVEPMSSIRKKTADHLTYAAQTIPVVTQFDKADITQIEIWRKDLNQKYLKSGVKITMTAILLKILSEALKKFPDFNTSIDSEKSTIIRKNFINIGVAVDTDRGLLVPVLKNSDQKNLFETATLLQELSTKARDRKLTLDEMQGGNMTLTNLGGVGGTFFTPIINSPEVAILGVSKAEMMPIFSEDKFIPRLMMPLSLTYDHRIIDGVQGVNFLKWIISALENPLFLV